MMTHRIDIDGTLVEGWLSVPGPFPCAVIFLKHAMTMETDYDCVSHFSFCGK